MLKRKIQALTKQNEVLSESVSCVLEKSNAIQWNTRKWLHYAYYFDILKLSQYQKANNELIGMEITSIKWSELAQSLQRSNET